MQKNVWRMFILAEQAAHFDQVAPASVSMSITFFEHSFLSAITI